MTQGSKIAAKFKNGKYVMETPCVNILCFGHPGTAVNFSRGSSDVLNNAASFERFNFGG